MDNAIPPLEPLPLALLKSVRVLLRLIAGIPHFTKLGAASPPLPFAKRASELTRICSDLLRLLNVEIRTAGPIPQSGLLISNHVSFVDILVLSSIQPTVFVSKSEVQNWPIIGPIALGAGTLFIDRRRKSDVARLNQQLRHTIDSGVLVTLFPEGTSSDGSSVLPFMPSLLQPAIETGTPITPAFLRYCDHAGQRIDEVAYFGDRALQDCLWHLIKRQHTFVDVRFDQSIPPGADRKSLAASLHSKVTALSKAPL